MAGKRVPNSEGTQFKKGKSGNPNGRPRKWVSTLTDIGYKKSEIHDCLRALMAMDMDELTDVYKNPNATMLEKTVANALRADLKKGTTTTIDKIIERVDGKPAQEIRQHNIGAPTAMKIEIVRGTSPEDDS